MTTLAFLDIGFGEMVVVAFVALLLFGGRLPEMMRKFGASYREFRRGLEDLSRSPLNPRAPSSSVPYKPTLPPVASAGGAPEPAIAPPSAAPMPRPAPPPAFAEPPPAGTSPRPPTAPPDDPPPV